MAETAGMMDAVDEMKPEAEQSGKVEFTGLEGISFFGCKDKEGPIQVAAYVRVSTDMGQEGSFETQRDYFEMAIAKRKGWILDGVYGDFGKSATQIEGRHGFQTMLEHADKGKIDYVIAKSISRFSRSIVDTLSIIRKMDERGVGVYFMEQGFDTRTPEGGIILTALASISQMESESIGENIRMVFDAKNAKGAPARKCCYGYEKDGADWIVDEKKAARVKLGFLMAASGYTFAEIARRLNQFEEVDRSGKEWTGAIVKRMLTNEGYIGDVLTNKTVKRRTEDGHKVMENKGLEDQYRISGHHEPMVGEELFKKIGEMLKGKELAGQENFKGVDGVRLIARKDGLLDDVRRFVPGKPGRYMKKLGLE